MPHAYAGHDVENLVEQLKVRILELLLKMQPKLKVKAAAESFAMLLNKHSNIEQFLSTMLSCLNSA